MASRCLPVANASLTYSHYRLLPDEMKAQTYRAAANQHASVFHKLLFHMGLTLQLLQGFQYSHLNAYVRKDRHADFQTPPRRQ